MDDVYALSDKAISLLTEKAIKRFEKAKKKAALLKFDELNVIQITKELYSLLKSDNEETFLDLAIMVYRDTEPHGDKEPDLPWILALMDEYDPVTRYRYSTEIERKREYTAEGINSSTKKASEFKRGLLYWTRTMIVHQCDRITDRSMLKAYKDAGIEKVRWVTQEDERVCDKCEPLDGKVFSIDKVPAKQHMNCRCYFEPVFQ